MKKVLIMVNLVAGTGKAASLLPEVLNGLASRNCEVTVYPINPEAHLNAEEILRKTEGRFDTVLCIGGDGTLNHMINGMMALSHRVPYAFIPLGSCNDFSKSLYGGADPTVADIIGAVTSGSPFFYDIGRFNEQYFNYVAAFGAFTDVSYTTRQDLKNVFGYGAYVLNVLGTLPNGLSTRLHASVTCDEGTVEGDYAFGGICNSRSVGGVQTPWLADALLTDGKFELILIDAPNDIFELNEVVAGLRRGDTSNPHVHLYQGSHFRFVFDQDVAWTLDGEDGGKVTRADINVEAGAIAVMFKNK